LSAFRRNNQTRLAFRRAFLDGGWTALVFRFKKYFGFP
jgi:hypothetical protein